MIRKHPLFLFPFFEKKGEEKTFLSDETAPPVQQKYVDYFSTRLSLPSRGREKEERTIFPSFLFPSPGFSSFLFLRAVPFFIPKQKTAQWEEERKSLFFLSRCHPACMAVRRLVFYFFFQIFFFFLSPLFLNLKADILSLTPPSPFFQYLPPFLREFFFSLWQDELASRACSHSFLSTST